MANTMESRAIKLKRGNEEKRIKGGKSRSPGMLSKSCADLIEVGQQPFMYSKFIW